MKNIRIAIISANYRKVVTDLMESACIAALKKKGIKKRHIALIHVPGSLEIPLVAQKLAKLGTFDAIIAFGVVLKGDTYHFEQVANESVRGCMDVSRKYEVPVIYEVLPVYDMQHARNRAKSRGVEGAEAAVRMVRLLKDEITNFN